MLFKFIQTSKGERIKVDPEYYKDLNKRKWYVTFNGYARCDSPRSTLMHRVIAQTPKGLYTDHINGNRLDNRSCNLRVVSQLVNGRNRFKSYGTKRTPAGVRKMPLDKDRRVKPWQAYTKVNYKFKSIGYFRTRREAVVARKEYERKVIACFTK